jgi:hypothetical protein
MQRMMMAAAALLLGAGVAVSTAKAEMNYGPIQDKGLCFKRLPYGLAGELGYGYWAECPKPAAAPVVHRHSSKKH